MLGFGLGVWPNGTLQASGPIAPPPPPSQEATPGLAWNVGQLSPVSPNRPYLNLAKQSGGWAADNGTAFTKNADGYPTAMENGATKYISSVNIGAEETSFRSRWRLTWDGDGTMAAGQSTTNAVTVGPNEIEFTPAAISNNLQIFWEITGFGATGVSNVAVVRLDRKDLYDTGERYEPVWLQRISSGGQSRFLNWMRINSVTNPPTLATRPKVSSYVWSGLPVEIGVDICNRTNSDFWALFNHQAPQDFVEFYAAYIRDNLNSHLKVIFEVSNEPWNSAFAQTEYYFARGLEYFSGTQMAGTISVTDGSNIVTGVGTAFDTELSANDIVGVDGEFFIVNTVESATQFTSDSGRTSTKTATGLTGFFGNGGDYRHHDAYVYEASIKRDWFDAVFSGKVEYHLNGQYAVSTGISRLIDSAAWAAQTPTGGVAWTPRNLKWDRIGLGLYFGGGLVSDLPKVATLQALIDAGDDAGVSALVDTYLREDGVIGALPDIIEKVRGHHRVCKAEGISLDVYEEGPHISHSTGTSTNASEDTMLAVQQIWRKSAECAAFMADFFDVHRAFIDARYNHFDLHHAPSRSGDWGAYRLIDDPDAAADTMVAFLLTIPSQPVWYGADVAPVTFGALPAITATEFDEVNLQTDLNFSANTVTYSSPDLPDGLSIDADTGEISGFLTDSSSGVGAYTIVATNPAGSVSAQGAFNITDVVSVSPDNPAYGGIAWIDPSDLTSFTASGDNVETITDKLNAFVHTFAINPTSGELTVNGQNLLKHFNDYTTVGTETAVVGLTTGFTMYSLHRVGISGLTDTPIARYYGGDQLNFGLSIGNSKDETFFLQTTAGRVSVAATTTGSSTAPRLTTVRYDGATLSIQVAEATVSIPVTGDVSLPSGGCRIGRGSSGNNGIRSYLGEMLVCDRAHTPAEVAEMQSYFNLKYGLPDYT